MGRRNRIAEENKRRATNRRLPRAVMIVNTEDIQNLFRETIAEAMEDELDAALDDELGCGKHDCKNKDTDNKRNGHSSKTLRISLSDFEVSVLRDRKVEFEPEIQ